MAGLLALLLLPALLGMVAGCRTEEEFVSEGTLRSPTSLGSPTVTHLGSVGVEGSFYTVSVTSTTTYTITLTEVAEDVDLFVYDSGGFFKGTVFCFAATVGITNETCSSTAGSSTLYIYVYPATGNSIDYVLTVQ